jgi:transposase
MTTEAVLRQRYERLLPHLHERSRRLVLGADALEEGRGGVARVARAAEVSRETVYAGMRALAADEGLDLDRVRQPGGGRKRVEDTQPGLLAALEALIDPVTRGDPESPLRWTSKSCVKLAQELQAQGFHVSDETVRRLLHDLDYSLQAPVKVDEGGTHPDRDEQFAHIHDTVQALQEAGVPVISVDGKKKS